MREFPNTPERPAGKIPTTGVTNELARAVQALAPELVSGGQPRPTFGKSDFFWAVITDKGPPDPITSVQPPDYTDERYWVRRSYIDKTDAVTTAAAISSTPITTTYENDAQDKKVILTATNINEMYLDKEEGGIAQYQSGTHLVAKGTRVFVWYDIDGASPYNIRYFFSRQVEYRVRPTANAAGGGKYYGYLLGPPTAAVNATANLSLADMGVEPSAQNCLILNAAEEGKATHDLTEGSPVSRTFVGAIQPRKSDPIAPDPDDPDDPGTPAMHVVLINGFDFGDCTPPT